MVRVDLDLETSENFSILVDEEEYYQAQLNTGDMVTASWPESAIHTVS